MRSQREGRREQESLKEPCQGDKGTEHPVGQWTASVYLSQEGQRENLPSRMQSRRGLSVVDFGG